MAYSAAKAALTNSSKPLSKQVAQFGVHVDTVATATGFIETEGANGLIEKTASESGSDLDNERHELGIHLAHVAQQVVFGAMEDYPLNLPR
jgi:NAD(P)-dependent dehydrogenase (short-subunit alcohol dehydrogenase family)